MADCAELCKGLSPQEFEKVLAEEYLLFERIRETEAIRRNLFRFDEIGRGFHVVYIDYSTYMNDDCRDNQ